MSYGLTIFSGNRTISLSEMVTQPKTLQAIGYAGLNGANWNSFWLPYVEVNVGAMDRYVGFELLDGGEMYGFIPGSSQNIIRLLTNKATNYALIGDSAIPAGYGIEIYNPSGVRVLSDNAAVWPMIASAELNSAAYSMTYSVPASRRVFVFGISSAVIRVSGGYAYFAGIKRNGNTITLYRDSLHIGSTSYLGTGTLDFGERPMSLKLFEVATL